MLEVPSEYPTIAAALAVSTAGDVIEIACGTYAERGLAMRSGVTLRSESGDPACVTIDAGGVGRVILCQAVSPETRIEGLTLTGGAVQGDSPARFGAGMLCIGGASPQVVNCVFDGNASSFGRGAGLACVDSSPQVLNCVFRENDGGEYSAGGGVSCLRSGARFEGCEFTGNIAGNGAGLYAEQSPLTIRSCVFRDNVATNNCAGVYLRSGDVFGEATISHCLFEGNHCEGAGGAILCYPMHHRRSQTA